MSKPFGKPFDRSTLEYPKPLAATQRRKYVAKSQEATKRRRIAGKRNWDVLQLTNVIGQLERIRSNITMGEIYKLANGAEGASATRADISLAIEFAEDALAAIKAHNKDPKNNPLP